MDTRPCQKTPPVRHDPPHRHAGGGRKERAIGSLADVKTAHGHETLSMLAPKHHDFTADGIFSSHNLRRVWIPAFGHLNLLARWGG